MAVVAGWAVNLVALMAGWTGGLMGFENTREKLEEAACEIEISLETIVTNAYQQMSLVWQKVETDIIPEANQTIVYVRGTVTELVCVATDRIIAAQETIRDTFGLGYLFMNRTSVFADVVDDVLVQLRFEVEIGLIMLYLFINMLCGFQLERMAKVQKPSAFMLLERDMVRLLKIACKLSCIFHVLYITGKLFYFLVLSRSQAGPDEILPWIILPIIVVLAINIGRILKTALSLYVFSFVGYIFWIPINLVLYPIMLLLYIILLQPTVWLVKVYEKRCTYKHQFDIYVIRLLIVIIPIIVILIFEVITTYISQTVNLGTGLLLATLITYVLYYITACTIIANYYQNRYKFLSNDLNMYCSVCSGDANVKS